jgi:hypothetical protein
VATLYDPKTVATLFAPTDRGIHNTIKQLMSKLGITLSTLLTDPVAAAKFVQAGCAALMRIRVPAPASPYLDP